MAQKRVSKQYTIQGTITNQNNEPLRGLVVKATDQDPKTPENPLGKPSTTDEKGKYNITYKDSDFRLGGKESGGADIIVRVYDKASKVIAQSKMYKNAGQKTTINLSIRQKTENEILANLALSNKKGLELDKLTGDERKVVNKLFNKALENRFIQIAGKDRAYLRNILQKTDLDYTSGMDLGIEEYFHKFVIPEVEKLELSKTEIDALQEVVNKQASGKIKDILQLESPFRENVILRTELRNVQTLEYAKLNGIKPQKAEQLKSIDQNWTEVNEATLSPFVTDGIITEDEFENLLVTADLTRLTGSNLHLIKTLKTPKLKKLEDLVELEKEDWIELIEKNNIPVPDIEESKETYAENLRKNIEATYPTKYFLKSVVRDNYTNEYKLLTNVEKLRSHNDVIIRDGRVDYNTINWQGIPQNRQKKMKAELNELAGFSNTYRHLGITEIINDSKLDKDKKKSQIEDRLKALEQFQKNNPSVEFAISNFLDENAFKWGGIKQPERKPVKSQMLAYQRVQNITNDTQTSEILLKNGLDSAMSVASLPEERFIEISGLDYEKSRYVYNKAKDNALASSHYFEAVRDALFGTFNDLAVSNQPSIVNDLKEIDGFDDLFGNQDFCDCEHCRSILSPAAYFTDLMFFIDENVSKKLFDPGRLTHPLYLKIRRPDLWNIKYTCDNTTTLISYLQVVNEVLEFFIKNTEEVTIVYKEVINEAQNATTLPVNVPLRELRLYLSHFDLSLFEIFKSTGIAKKEQHREVLNLSTRELEIITTPDPYNVSKRFGDESLSDFNVRKFIQYAGISRKELDNLLKTKFYPEISKVKIHLKKDSSDIQKYSEVLKKLTKKRLDLIHRYLRLWKKTNWTIPEFDLLLNSLKKAGILSKFNDTETNGDPSLLKLAEIVLLKDKIGLSAEELSAYVHVLPLISVKENQKKFFERLFDMEKVFGVASVDADGNKTYNTNTTLFADKTKDKVTPLLLAGLGISESELVLLLEYIGLDLSIDQIIDYVLVSKLFRYSRTGRALNWSIGEFVNAATILFPGSRITNTEQYLELIDFKNWLENSPFNIVDLNFIIQGIESGTRQFESNNENSASAILEIQNAPETDKKQLLLLHLQQTFNLTAGQLSNEILPNLVTVDMDGAGITTALNASFTNDQPDNLSDFDALTALKKELERFNLFFTKLEFTTTAISFLIGHKEVFNNADLKDFTFKEIMLADFYQKLVGIGIEPEQEILVQDALVQYQNDSSFNNESLTILATRWKQPAGQLVSLQSSFTFPSVALEAAKLLQKLNKLAEKLGLKGHNLKKLAATSYDEIVIARDIVLSAFTAKYTYEEERKEKLEPYTDKINTIKRDALCDYIIAQNDKFKFSDRSDLYNFFLLDVEMSGCFRTSRIVCAISSLQLYIHRCLINLEQSDKTLNPSIIDVKVKPTWIPAEEWEWRKNYRVWEANRKVFLYPENYIDPTFRDNKTHLFKELEEELLQEKITKESAEEAYKKYITQFSELTKLRFSGAYYESTFDDFNYWNFGNTSFKGFFLLTGVFFSFESEDSKYYLFARTNTDPYQYYYRTYNHYKLIWGNWIKMEVAIEAKEISALVFRGKLYIFWTEVQTKEINKLSGGESSFNGTIFKAYTKYCFLKEDGKWSPPQRIYLGYIFADEEKTFRRALNNYPGNENTRDKKHDEVYTKFKQKVFRKPYVLKSGDITTPFDIAHIWSQNKGITQAEYSIYGTSYKYLDFQVISYRIRYYFKTPTVKFNVYNNNFSNTKVTVKGKYIYKINNDTISDTEADFTFYLENATICKVRTGNIVYTLPVHSNTISSNIEVSTLPLSLSKNDIINTSTEDLEYLATNLNNSANNFLKKEYNIAFLENGSFSHYIESGDRNFTDFERRITQSQNGEANLIISNNGIQENELASAILTDEFLDVLYAKGLQQFLSLQTQNMTNTVGDKVNLKGAYGEYYWEMFFHIPFLIANNLNANQKFKEAKWWYERIFNPTSEEDPGGLKPSDHNWQFRGFRNLDIEKLKEILTDDTAIEAYKEDPFNPHGIARLRINAYQKSIVMKYVDNLLDWGDYLFTQDTRESITEAFMLYQLAFDILGKRPVKLGKCETAESKKLTYDKIKDRIGKGSEFLITLENSHLIIKQDYLLNIKPFSSSKHLLAGLQDANKMEQTNKLADIADLAQKVRISDTFNLNLNARGLTSNTAVSHTYYNLALQRVFNYDDVVAEAIDAKVRKSKWADIDKVAKADLKERKPKRLPSLELVKTSQLVFCVPHNAGLLDYWDRVEDRLYKIRNCMNLSGVRRSLALFQPPIDPALLVRAKAAGLSMEDILSSLLPQLPPYRFEYMLEKAKQFTQMVRGLGNALLSALEKKDAKELIYLRSTHEQNFLKLTRNTKRLQLEEVRYQYKSMQESMKNVQNRINYYQGLIDTGLIPWETTQQVSKHAATALRTTSSLFYSTGGIAHLLPQLGSPFAMKWGGHELGHSAEKWGQFMNTLASILLDVSASAALEATFQRREEEWDKQLTLAEQELKQMEQQILAAEIRQQIAEKDLEIHEKSIEQAKELHDFYKNKFTNLGLYNFLSSNLSRLYRQGFNIAVDVARMAEQAYQFELNDTTFFIGGDNWESDKSGLLAGDRLQLQLQQMEQAYIKGNVRKQEITQTFSLALLSPVELVNLRQTGACILIIPEIAFEMMYPGHYRRLIKSVKVTIPGIVGPYTNVSAKLTLTKGYIEKTDGAALAEHLTAKNTSISLSGAVNDTGTFEFNLRDKRYLPFEGGGAISEWKIELPSKIRSFDYKTISDVLITIGYTAIDGDRVAAENTILTTFTDFVTNNGLFMLISLKHEMPNAYHKLLHPDDGNPQTTEFDITESHFPYLLQGKGLTITETKVYLEPAKGNSITPPDPFKINGNNVTWATSEDIADPANSGNTNKLKGGTAGLNGSPIKKWSIDAGINGLIENKLENILLLVKYKVS